MNRYILIDQENQTHWVKAADPVAACRSVDGRYGPYASHYIADTDPTHSHGQTRGYHVYTPPTDYSGEIGDEALTSCDFVAFVETQFTL